MRKYRKLVKVVYIFKKKILVNADSGNTDYKAKFFKVNERPLCTWSD